MKDIYKQLYNLSKTIAKKTKNNYRGGEFGYGQYYENEVFKMHPFCWCEKDDCGYNVKYNESERLPNFLYKPSGFKLWWYKYMGRGEEQSGTLPKDWYEKCIKSLSIKENNKELKLNTMDVITNYEMKEKLNGIIDRLNNQIIEIHNKMADDLLEELNKLNKEILNK